MYARLKNLADWTQGLKVYHRLPLKWKKNDGAVIYNFRSAHPSIISDEGFRLVVIEVLLPDYIYGPVTYDNQADTFTRTQKSIYDGITLTEYKKSRAREIVGMINDIINLTREAYDSYIADSNCGVNITRLNKIRNTARDKRKQFFETIQTKTTYAQVNTLVDIVRAQIEAVEAYDIFDDYLT